MNIALLTPGTGSYHCGVCMRDNALAKELIRQGHRALLLLDLYGALRPLDEITGVTSNDDILNLIFSRFCIGK